MNRKKELIKFGKEIVILCQRIGIELILYGSLLYSHYTKRQTEINDIDFYVPENSLKKIIRILKQNKIKYNYSREFHTLQIFKDKLKVEMDSIDYWYGGSKEFNDFDFEGVKIKSLSLNQLRKVYKRASKVSKENHEGNLKKFNELREIK